MIIKDFLEVLKKHNIPEDVRIISDSKCNCSDIDAIFYDKNGKCLNLAQGDAVYINKHLREYLIYIDNDLIDAAYFSPIYNPIYSSQFKIIGHAALDENNQVIFKRLEEKNLTF